MTEAMRYGRPTASGRLILSQDVTEGSNRPGFIIYMPVFGLGADGAKLLKGFVYSPFVADAFLRSALQLKNSQDVGIRLATSIPNSIISNDSWESVDGRLLST